MANGTTPLGFGVGECEPTGLAWHDDTLYMVGRSNAVLYTLNPSSGTASPASGIVGLEGGAHSLTDLTSHEGKLYVADSSKPCLYLLDTGTGEATGIPMQGNPVGYPRGIASHDGELCLITWVKNPNGITTTKDVALHKLIIKQDGISQAEVGKSIPLEGVFYPSGLFSYGSHLILGSDNGHYYSVNNQNGSTDRLKNPMGPPGSRLDFHNDQLYRVGLGEHAYLEVVEYSFRT